MSDRTSSANRVTWIWFFVNLLLTALKLTAGIIGHSGAMIAKRIRERFGRSAFISIHVEPLHTDGMPTPDPEKSLEAQS